MNAKDKNETQTMIDRTVAEAFRLYAPYTTLPLDVAKHFESRAAARGGEDAKVELNPCVKCGGNMDQDNGHAVACSKCGNESERCETIHDARLAWNAANPPAKPVERRYGYGVGARFVSRGKTRTASLAIHTNANQGPRLFILFSDGYCRFVQHGYTATLSEIFGSDADKWQPVESDSKEATP